MFRQVLRRARTAQRAVNFSKPYVLSSRSIAAIATSGADFSDGAYSHSRSAWRGATLMGVATAVACALFGINQADNCGIVGVVGGKDDCSGFLVEGLTTLRNRGYDSAGIASISSSGEPDLVVTKYASRDSTCDSIDLVKAHINDHVGHSTGIAHTRWATHGGKTDANAHPHVDSKRRIAVIHNGTINNSYDLKKDLENQGVKFTSETDTEVIAQLIGQFLDKGYDTKEAVERALSK